MRTHEVPPHPYTKGMKNKTAFQAIIEDLTPEEKRALREATAPEWEQAIRETVSDKRFWQDMALAFVAGVAEGITDALADRDR